MPVTFFSHLFQEFYLTDVERTAVVAVAVAVAVAVVFVLLLSMSICLAVRKGFSVLPL